MPPPRVTFFQIPKLDEYQHYKDRAPPWIKLHAKTLESYDFSRLQDASKAHLMLIWLLASRTENKLPYDPTWVGARINARDPVDLDELQALGFIEMVQSASAPQASRLHVARPETERETETKREKRQSREDTSARLPTSQGEKFDFEAFKAAYPKRSGSQPWARAVKAANARIMGGFNFDVMVDGARRYAEFCGTAGKIGTEYVMQAATFLGPELHFLEPWDPRPSKSEALEQRNRQHAIDFIEGQNDERLTKG